MQTIYGENSDEEHLYFLEVMEKCFQIEVNSKTNIFSSAFMEHVAKKFSDLSKLENLDAQIFYYT